MREYTLQLGYKFNYPIEDVHWSNVIYVELIRWNGEKIAQAKFKLFENSASGYLTIPKTLLSGNYYIRAYTKWMRNFPVEDYFYKLIKVINPFESEIDTGTYSGTRKYICAFKTCKGATHIMVLNVLPINPFINNEKKLTLLYD